MAMFSHKLDKLSKKYLLMEDKRTVHHVYPPNALQIQNKSSSIPSLIQWKFNSQITCVCFIFGKASKRSS